MTTEKMGIPMPETLIVVAIVAIGLATVWEFTGEKGHQETMRAYQCARDAVRFKQPPDKVDACFTSRGLTPPWGN